MKRSTIDAAIDRCRDLCAEWGYRLPEWAAWPRQAWLDDVDKLRETMRRGIGWDVTDFGRGDFGRYGLTACTLRNGSLVERDAGRGETFAEKIMAVEPGQETPFHLHVRKTEDIVNRGGGLFRIELLPQPGGPGLGQGAVTTFVTGVRTAVPAGQQLDVAPGGWVQVPAGYYHRFWAVDRATLIGEVSGVNDDATDNVFLDPSARYPEVIEDAPARYLTVAEYAAVLAAR
jgi:D-lyxose ketol-isomerase